MGAKKSIKGKKKIPSKKVVDMVRTSKGKKKPRERAKQNRVDAVGKTPKGITCREINRLPRPGAYMAYTPEQLLEKAEEYLQWANDNPLQEQKVLSTRTGVKYVNVNKVRAVTMGAFQIFAGVYQTYISELGRDKPEQYSQVISTIERALFNRKFEAASADLLNANLISRELGLKERVDTTSGDSPIGTPQVNVYNNAPPMASDEKEVDVPKGK